MISERNRNFVGIASTQLVVLPVGAVKFQALEFYNSQDEHDQ